VTSSTEPTRYRVEVHLSYVVDVTEPSDAQEKILSALEHLGPDYYYMDVIRADCFTPRVLLDVEDDPGLEYED
jgi:hypothetical protein